MKRISFILGFGFLPLWVAIIYSLIGSLFSTKYAQYGWKWYSFYIFGSIGLSFITLAITAVTLTVYNRTSGDTPRKKKFAINTFISLIFLICVGVAIFVMQEVIHANDWKNEQSLLVNFVVNNETVLRTVGKNFRAAYSGTYIHDLDADGRANKYQVVIMPFDSHTKDLYAVVKVSRSSGQPEFTLACLTANMNDECN